MEITKEILMQEFINFCNDSSNNESRKYAIENQFQIDIREIYAPIGMIRIFKEGKMILFPEAKNEKRPVIVGGNLRPVIEKVPNPIVFDISSEEYNILESNFNKEGYKNKYN